MRKFFAKPENVTAGGITIVGDDVNHIKNVLRMRPGDRICVSCGDGYDFFCVIKDIKKDSVVCGIEKKESSQAELKTRIYLFAGLSKADRMDFVVQKATELGVFRIIPTQFKRSVAAYDAGRAASKQKRWQTIAENAAKQSKRGIIPAVSEIVSFDEALGMAGELDLVIVPYESAEGIEETRKVLMEAGACGSVGVFVGPEGGFEESEIEGARKIGGRIVTLGRRTLRTETAAIAVTAAVMLAAEDD